MKANFFRFALLFSILVSTFIFSTGTTYAQAHKMLDDLQDLRCGPKLLTGTAFPYQGQLGVVPPSDPYDRTCSTTFYWGYTVTGNPSGEADWESFYYGTNIDLFCRAQAFIPDNHAGTYNAQYYLWDGNTYLGNDAYVDQYDNVGWVDIYGTGYQHIHDHMRITLNDHNPMAGGATQMIAAYAIRFLCHY